MAGASLVVAYHADDVEILSRVDLVVGLRLGRLVDDALADVRKQLPRHRVCDRAVAGRLLEADRVVHARQVASARAHLELLKVERFYLADERVLELQAIARR